MKLDQIIDTIVEEGHLPDRNETTVIKWSIENKIEENFMAFLSAINEDDLQIVDVPSRGEKRISVKKLEHSTFFIILANSYAQIRLFEKAIKIFEGMFQKGSNESTMLNDY